MEIMSEVAFVTDWRWSWLLYLLLELKPIRATRPPAAAAAEDELRDEERVDPPPLPLTLQVVIRLEADWRGLMSR